MQTELLMGARQRSVFQLSSVYLDSDVIWRVHKYLNYPLLGRKFMTPTKSAMH